MIERVYEINNGGVVYNMLCTYSDAVDKLEQRGTDNKRYIYILLMRYPDTFSKVFQCVSRSKYNHVSIGISDSNDTFYSYVIKGFRKELPRKYPTFNKKEVPCALYSIEVSDEVYRITKATLDEHEKQSYKFKYNLLGVILCLLKVVYPMKNRYFCSQFVSEILDQMKAVRLSKHSALYMPDDFTKMKDLDLCFSGYLSQLVIQPRYSELLIA